MASLPRRLLRHAGEIKDLCRCRPSLQALRTAVVATVTEALAAEACAFLTTDPATFLVTDAYVRGFDHVAAARFFGHIYLQREQISLLDMRARGETVSVLSCYTNGKPELEERYREIYRPAGLKDEIRACLHTGNAYWGALCIARADDRPNFSEGERLFLQQIAPPVAESARVPPRWRRPTATRRTRPSSCSSIAGTASSSAAGEPTRCSARSTGTAARGHARAHCSPSPSSRSSRSCAAPWSAAAASTRN